MKTSRTITPSSVSLPAWPGRSPKRVAYNRTGVARSMRPLIASDEASTSRDGPARRPLGLDSCPSRLARSRVVTQPEYEMRELLGNDRFQQPCCIQGASQATVLDSLSGSGLSDMPSCGQEERVRLTSIESSNARSRHHSGVQSVGVPTARTETQS